MACMKTVFILNFLCVFIALNSQIRVADRPMTKQGLTGIKTSAGRGINNN